MKTTTLKLAFQKLGGNEVVIIRDFSSKKSLPSRAVKHYLAAWTEKTLTNVRVYKVTSEADQKGIYCPCIWVSGADLAAQLASSTPKKSPKTSSKPAPKKPTTKKASKPSSKKTTKPASKKPTTKKSTKTSSQPSPKKAEPKVTKLSELSSILGDKVVQSIDIVDGKLVITL